MTQGWNGNSAAGVRKAAEASAAALLSTDPPVGAQQIFAEHANRKEAF